MNKAPKTDGCALSHFITRSQLDFKLGIFDTFFSESPILNLCDLSCQGLFCPTLWRPTAWGTARHHPAPSSKFGPAPWCVLHSDFQWAPLGLNLWRILWPSAPSPGQNKLFGWKTARKSVVFMAVEMVAGVPILGFLTRPWPWLHTYSQSQDIL